MSRYEVRTYDGRRAYRQRLAELPDEFFDTDEYLRRLLHGIKVKARVVAGPPKRQAGKVVEMRRKIK